MPEQEKGEDGVSAAGEQGAGQGRQWACARVDWETSLKPAGSVCTCWHQPSSLDPSALPSLLSDVPSRVRTTKGSLQFLPTQISGSPVPPTEVRPLVLTDPDGPELVLPILVPWWLPRLSRVGTNEGDDNAMYVGSGHSTWAEKSSFLGGRKPFQPCLPAGSLTMTLEHFAPAPGDQRSPLTQRSADKCLSLWPSERVPALSFGMCQAGVCSFSAESHLLGLPGSSKMVDGSEGT